MASPGVILGVAGIQTLHTTIHAWEVHSLSQGSSHSVRNNLLFEAELSLEFENPQQFYVDCFLHLRDLETKLIHLGVVNRLKHFIRFYLLLYSIRNVRLEFLDFINIVLRVLNVEKLLVLIVFEHQEVLLVFLLADAVRSSLVEVPCGVLLLAILLSAFEDGHQGFGYV